METPPKPTESNSTPTTQDAAKPTKEKKPRTEAQVAATQKALAAMTAARKAKAVKQIEKKEEIKKAKKVVEDKILKEDVGLVTRNDFEAMKKELYELKGLMSVKQQAESQRPAPSKPAERIVERVIERVPTPSAQPTKLTGHALLDSLFFK
jgi:hypothetical protein